MKKLSIAIIVAAVVLSVAIGFTSLADQPDLPSYELTVTITDEGKIELSCKEGCAWEELSFSCGGKLPCTAVVDEHGVSGLKEK